VRESSQIIPKICQDYLGDMIKEGGINLGPLCNSELLGTIRGLGGQDSENLKSGVKLECSNNSHLFGYIYKESGITEEVAQ
jgi:hypothetical protein